MGVLLEHLRRETADAHRRLEDGLGLGPDTLDEKRVRHLLERFHAFYGAWEPWLIGTGLDPGFVGPRLKRHLVARDLQALGLENPDMIPVAPLSFGRSTLNRGLGSLYVIEGSTLGSQILKRWMRDAPWMPQGGLTYFDSYRQDVGAMWRSFSEALDGISAKGSTAEITAAALETFTIMDDWLCRGQGNA